jgi:hypothetical protein
MSTNERGNWSIGIGNATSTKHGTVTTTYPDEAVVEEEADDARPVAGVHADGAVHDGLDEVLGAGAGGVVVPDLQLRLRREAGQCHEDGEPNDLRTPGHLSTLLSSAPRDTRRLSEMEREA